MPARTQRWVAPRAVRRNASAIGRRAAGWYSGMRLRLPNLRTNVHVDQPGRARTRHETAGPIFVKILLVAPDHLEPSTSRLLQNEPVIKVPLPRRRMSTHEINIERCRPAQHAALDLQPRLVAQ